MIAGLGCILPPRPGPAHSIPQAPSAQGRGRRNSARLPGRRETESSSSGGGKAARNSVFPNARRQVPEAPRLPAWLGPARPGAARGRRRWGPLTSAETRSAVDSCPFGQNEDNQQELAKHPARSELSSPSRGIT